MTKAWCARRRGSNQHGGGLADADVGASGGRSGRAASGGCYRRAQARAVRTGVPTRACSWRGAGEGRAPSDAGGAAQVGVRAGKRTRGEAVRERGARQGGYRWVALARRCGVDAGVTRGWKGRGGPHVGLGRWRVAAQVLGGRRRRLGWVVAGVALGRLCKQGCEGRWTAAGTLQSKYHSKMAGMNAPVVRPKGSRKLKSSAEEWGSINAFPLDVASPYGSTPPPRSFKRASRSNHPERSIAKLLSGIFPDKGADSVVLDNYRYYRTVSSTPLMGHLLGDLLQRLPSSPSHPHSGCKPSRTTRPTIKRRINCLAVQRVSQRDPLSASGDRHFPYTSVRPDPLRPNKEKNVGSRATRSRQSRAESRQRSPPNDVNIAPAGANNNVPAPAVAAPATALEMAELRGQMQQLTGVCLALQAQLVGPPAPVVPLPREWQAESSHRRSRVLPAPQDQQVDSPRRSHRAPSQERAPERRGRSPRRSVVSPRPLRSVVGANSHVSGRGGFANSEQELARHLRRVVDLEHRVDAMVQRAEGKAPAKDDLDFRSPFSSEILEARVSPKLPLPTIAPYDGTTDLADHIHGFESHMVFHGASDAAKCRAFPKSFRDNFLGGRSQPRTAASLLAVRQKKGEALWDFVKRFRTEALCISRLDVPLATSALIQGTRDGFLQRTLGVQQLATLAELLSIAQRHAACEESLAAGRAEQGEQSDKKRPSDNDSDRDRKKGRRNGDSPRRPRPFTNYTPLTVAPKQILTEIRNEAYVRWPQRMRSDPRRRDQNKYCRFHRDHGHDTSECCQLKDEIEDLIKRGYLGQFVRRNEDRPRRREWTPEHPINNEPNGQEINSTPYPTSPARAPPEEAITFSDEDLVGVTTPHADALVISATINHCNVRRILVDNGSAPDVLAYDCFVLKGLKTDQLAPVNSPLFGFSGVSVQPMGRVRLPITLGTAPRIVTKVVDFLVINNMPGYNAILSRGLIRRIKAVPSSLHQKMKFPTPSGVGEVLGCQRESRRCYVLSLRDKQPLADPAPPTSDQPSISRGTPAEDLIPVQIRLPRMDRSLARDSSYTCPVRI
ncbi:hypothetical protein Taro_001379 [Colocasia esculenta]|uniref:Retrotransposon gag domain-containing protein n=1 Tax=Colocasia esculenta TaxID=4460 RepID=A0A843TIT0_COLES|nr:hypothetical protein [Colocasia esculenta]